MARVSLSDEELYKVSQLKQAVQEYFKISWKEIWINHGKSFEGYNTIHNKSRFFDDVRDYIDQLNKEKYGLELAAQKSTSRDSIRRFLQEDQAGFEEKTLDAFVLLSGVAENWQEFRKPRTAATFNLKQQRNKPKLLWISSAVAVVVLLVAGIYYLNLEKTISKPELTATLLHSPSFPKKIKVQYNLNNNYYDDAFIFFNGQKKRIEQPKGEIILKCSGPKNALISLFVDEKQIGDVQLLVPTNGWLGQINNYHLLKNELFENNKILHLPFNYDLNDRFGPEFYTSFINFQNYDISGDSFELEADIKNNAEDGGIWAYDISVDIVGTKDNFTFNLLDPKATIYAKLEVGLSDFQDGHDKLDLSNLGVNLDIYRHLKVTVNNGIFDISLDNKTLIKNNYKGELGNILGLQFYMKGCGFVKNISLQPFDTPSRKVVL